MWHTSVHVDIRSLLIVLLLSGRWVRDAAASARRREFTLAATGAMQLEEVARQCDPRISLSHASSIIVRAVFQSRRSVLSSAGPPGPGTLSAARRRADARAVADTAPTQRYVSRPSATHIIALDAYALDILGSRILHHFISPCTRRVGRCRLSPGRTAERTDAPPRRPNDISADRQRHI